MDIKLLKIIIASVLLLTITVNGKSQGLRYEDTDTIKRPWLAGVEVIGLNVIVNRFNFYTRPETDFSKVGLNSWKRNLQHPLEWDWNNFTVNHIGHPYQGSLYYSSARSLGLNYWQSGGYALLGSATWEYFGEKHPPSGNDLINTTMGGMFLGEVMHRFSDLIIDGSAVGFERVVREFFGFVVNPMNGFNRLLTGKMRKYERRSGYVRPAFHGSISLGSDNYTQSAIATDVASGTLLDLELQYGDAFDESVPNKRPFDVFNTQISYHATEVDTNKNVFIGLHGYGNIFLRDISSEATQHQHVFGIFHIYDFLNAGGQVEIGGMGVSPGLLSKIHISDKIKLNTEVLLGPIVLGGSNSEVVDVALYSDDPTDSRDYILGPGFKSNLAIRLEAGKLGHLRIGFQRWDIYVASGPAGREELNTYSVEYKLPIYRGFNLGARYTVYDRTARYDDFADIKENFVAFRPFLSYRF